MTKIRPRRPRKRRSRPRAERLKELDKRIKSPTINQTVEERNAEWAKLKGQMEELLHEWAKW
ncbi:hypothetical protein ACFL2Q_02085 [Thermodesulfobacteriota bacterium]